MPLGLGARAPAKLVMPSFGGPGPRIVMPAPATVGAGQGPGTQATGQAADNPFNNQFYFQIPQAPSGSSDGSTPAPAASGSGGISQYAPLIIVGVIVAGLGYYLFQRKK